MKKKYFIIPVMLFLSCHFSDQKKTVSIMMDASGTFNVKSGHIKIFKNDEKIADTIVIMDDLHPDLPKLIARFKLDSTEKNILVVSINSKSADLDLNKIHLKKVNIHIFYDDITIIQNKIRVADSLAQLRNETLNSKKLADSLRHLTPSKLDTLILKIEQPPTGSSMQR